MNEGSENIKDLIKESGLKAYVVAEAVGVSKQSLNTWQNENKPEQIEKVKMAIRKSQVGDGNHYNDVNKDLIRVLRELVATQKDSILHYRAQIKMQGEALIEKTKVLDELIKEVRLWRDRCEECEKNANKG